MNVKYEGISCQWHCPNCGALVQGIKNGDGIAKGECRSCGSSMVRKFMGRRHERLDVYAPKGQEVSTHKTEYSVTVKTVEMKQAS